MNVRSANIPGGGADASKPGSGFGAWILLLIASIAILASGCAGYQLGPTAGPAGETSVQINPFLNRTLEPRLTDAVALQLRKELQRDGAYRLASHDDGDIVVSGTITRYDRLEVSFEPNDVLTVRDYRLQLTAQIGAFDRRSGKVLLDQQVKGVTLVRVGTDLISSERQALPLLAEDLAKNVTRLLADGSW
jgi:Lipopolysaccharide-assembly